MPAPVPQPKLTPERPQPARVSAPLLLALLWLTVLGAGYGIYALLEAAR